jgi:hypothetical protein
MLLSLLRLDFISAFQANAVLFCLLPILFGLLAVWLFRYIRWNRRDTGPLFRAVEWSMVIVLLLWGVIRNFIGM